MTLCKYAGFDDSYYMVGCNDERLYGYPYCNFDGCDFYWVNIDADAEEAELEDLICWAAYALDEEIVIEEE